MSEKCLSLTSFSIAIRAHNQRLRLIKQVLLSLSRKRKRAGSPDDPQQGWLFQGTNAWATAKGTSYGEQNTGRTLCEIMQYKRVVYATNSPRPRFSLKCTRTSSNTMLLQNIFETRNSVLDPDHVTNVIIFLKETAVSGWGSRSPLAARHKGQTKVPTEYSRPLFPPSFFTSTLFEIGRLLFSRSDYFAENRKKGTIRGGSGPTPVARGGSGNKAPPLAMRPRAPTGKQHTFMAKAAAYTAKHCNILLQTATRCLTLHHSPI